MDELYMNRCFDLARMGSPKVSPNPMVGAVVVANNRIIGEGFHKAYGQPHAEVKAVNSIKPEDIHLLSVSTIYVSLEPCCIHGKTPPCTNLILDNKIPRVVISSLDRSPEVNGKSLDILRNAGVEVIENILPVKGAQLSQARTTYVCNKRPYVILKYAQSKDGFISSKDGSPVWISNQFTKRLTHKWRSEINAIMVGTNTAKMDDPNLNNRHYHGNSPVRIVLDRNLSLNKELNLFDQTEKTIVINELDSKQNENIYHIKLNFNDDLLENILKVLHKHEIGVLMVEGGSILLNTFIQSNLWDEARVITGQKYLIEGTKAPNMPLSPTQSLKIDTDEISIYLNT
jgi:diaminohydroxyphosphoribosylaminopyrimidine deaminase/5-amino-6-(5-phosphoribosylamino)uracil reductase